MAPEADRPQSERVCCQQPVLELLGFDAQFGENHDHYFFLQTSPLKMKVTRILCFWFPISNTVIHGTALSAILDQVND